MAVRYIGSKARLASSILDIIEDRVSRPARFVDGFCGTGVVSQTAAKRDWQILANDALYSSGLITKASLLSDADLDFSRLKTYENAIESLNALPPVEGFIWRSYSPASIRFCPYERRYFSESNAKKIDAARCQIESWKQDGLVSENEEAILVADLIEAANSVANIAGTYGCFLKKWTSQSSGNLVLKPRILLPHPIAFEVSSSDIFLLETKADDVVYLDPPYTKRQYASYYHIPETIAYNDAPNIEGVAGLRPWKHNASPFCYKTKALRALFDCINNMSAHAIFLSYSSQGHVHLEDLIPMLESIGEVSLFELGEIGRYRPNKTAADACSSVSEYLIMIDKTSGD